MNSAGKVNGLDTGIVTITYAVASMPPVVHTIKIIDCRLGIPSLDELKVTVFPNPTNDELNISGVTNTISYRLLNLTGSAVCAGILQPAKSIIKTGSLPSGVYTLEITD